MTLFLQFDCLSECVALYVQMTRYLAVLLGLTSV